jgi:hypothetical protein
MSPRHGRRDRQPKGRANFRSWHKVSGSQRCSPMSEIRGEADMPRSPNRRGWIHCRRENRTGGDLERVAAGSMPPLAGEEVGQGRGTRPADVKALKSVLMNP